MLLDQRPIIIGALHLPLYGRANPSQSIAQLEDYVLKNCEIFYENGIKALYIQDENPPLGDATPETIAVMSSLGRMVKHKYPDLDLGIIIEAHDGISPIAIAQACGASFVRIKVFAGAMLKGAGIQQGVGGQAVQYRTTIGSDVKIFADAHDRMGYPLVDIPITTIADWVSRAGADGLILTGMDYAQSIQHLDACRAQIKKPIIMGGGVTTENVKEVLAHCDGAVVSTCLMLDEDVPGCHEHWDGEKIKRFMDQVR